MTEQTRDPRQRRHAFAAPVDARAAAGRLEVAADAMRAQQLERGNSSEEPPTGLLDLAAIRAALGAEPGGDVNPAAARWLAGEDEPDVEDQGEPEHTHPYFVEGCAECVERAEQLEVLEDERRRAAEPEPEPVRVVEVPPAPVEPVEPEHSPEPAPVPAVAPSPPAPVVDVVPAVFSSEHPRLSWRSRHDPRSRQYGVRRGLAGSAPLTDHVWPVGPVLDQGAEGACVGCAVVDAANAGGHGVPWEWETLADAQRIYRRAQQLDEVPGEDYSGTSVLAGMKAGVEAGLWGGYVWAFGTRDLAQAVLQVGPVIVGVPWLSGMYDTGPGGLVELAGEDTGAGHCLAVVGIRIHGPQGQLGPFFVWQNSWGAGYGDRGLGYIHHRDLATLLHGTGEAAIPTRAAQRV